VDANEARGVLGLASGATRAEVRQAYLRAVRAHHPDLADGSPRDALDRTRRTSHITEAYVVLQGALRGSGRLPDDPADQPPPPPTSRPPAPPAAPAVEHVVGPIVDTGEHDTIVVTAPTAETYALIAEAASRIGEVAYHDRQLGILETIVRFEGGPSCSVVLTTVPRGPGTTEVQCMMESIEADPTPPIRPVIEALIAEL
jgi:hypothetical protein